MTRSKAEQAERAQAQYDARVELGKILPVGTEVACVLTHVTRSGMSRSIKIILPQDDGRGVWDASWMVARAVGWRFDRDHGGVRVEGCGMDMGFHLVYTLSRILYPNGHMCTGVEERGPDRCPSNDHSNERGADRNYASTRIHRDGGYALRHKWI